MNKMRRNIDISLFSGLFFCLVFIGCDPTAESGSVTSGDKNQEQISHVSHQHEESSQKKSQDLEKDNTEGEQDSEGGLERDSGLPQTAGLVSGIELTGLDGKPVFPFEKSDAKAITFLFVCTDCPVACRYVPEMNKIYEDFQSKGIQFWLVYADEREDAETIKKHLKEYEHKIPACCDYDQKLVELTKATVTPEAAVFNDKGELVYRGRIDNRFHDYGETRAQATKQELRDALNAILENRNISVSKTEAVGCYIPEKS